MKDDDTGYIWCKLMMLYEAQLLWEQGRPGCIALFIWTLWKWFVELHVVMHVTSGYCMSVSYEFVL